MQQLALALAWQEWAAPAQALADSKRLSTLLETEQRAGQYLTTQYQQQTQELEEALQTVQADCKKAQAELLLERAHSFFGDKIVGC